MEDIRLLPLELPLLPWPTVSIIFHNTLLFIIVRVKYLWHTVQYSTALYILQAVKGKALI